MVIKKSSETGTPNLHKRLFWEFRFDEIDWQKDSTTVIERVVERGSLEEWDEMLRFYGERKVKNTLKKHTTYLTDRAIKKVCASFKLKPGDLKCYIRKRSRAQLWI